MLKASSSLFALGLIFAPPALYAQAQQPGQAKQPAAERKAEVKADTMIPASTLIDSRLYDAQNREIGNVRNLLIDPKTGRIMRADLELTKGTGWFGPDQKLSVNWDQLAVKRKNGELVVALQQAVLDKIQKDAKQPGAAPGTTTAPGTGAGAGGAGR